jgi:hypothetical protein
MSGERSRSKSRRPLFWVDGPRVPWSRPSPPPNQTTLGNLNMSLELQLDAQTFSPPISQPASRTSQQSVGPKKQKSDRLWTQMKVHGTCADASGGVAPVESSGKFTRGTCARFIFFL